MREFELAKLHETREVGILKPMRDKNEAMYWGRGGKTTEACARLVQKAAVEGKLPAS